MTPTEIIAKFYQTFAVEQRFSFRDTPEPTDRACLYRGPNGNQCAAGIFITNAAYSPDLENSNVFEGIVKDALEASGFPMENLNLLAALQNIHDSAVHKHETPEGRTTFIQNRLIALSTRVSDPINFKLPWEPTNE